MPKFGSVSKQHLATCAPELVDLFEGVIEVYDCSIICGYRGQSDQIRAYLGGFSKVKWPDSKHNAYPSRAVDVIPWPSGWAVKENFYVLHGVVMSVAHDLGIKIRWGGDWNRNGNLKDENFYDLAHYELVGSNVYYITRQ